MIDLATITGFDWDEGNARKNEKHGVSAAECEQIFFDAHLILLADAKHSDRELRFHALGNTDEGRLLHVAFTLREAGDAFAHAQIVRNYHARPYAREH